MVAVPLVAREKAVAVLYADSAGQDADAVNLEALETLVRVAGMAVELQGARRQAPAEAASARATVPPAPAPAEPQPREEEPRREESAPPQEAPQAEAHPAEPETPSPAVFGFEPQPIAAEAQPEPSFTSQPEPSHSFTTQPEHAVAEQPEAPAIFGASPEAAHADSSPAHADAFAPPAAESPAQPISPLGSSRRYGAADMDFPVEVAEDEKRFHNEARRFARLLVSEIKLYNEQKVREGRDASDLYDRLREDIDRSRQMYDKRVRPEVSRRYDYFDHELVNMLAEGDRNKLGADYPGAAVGA